MNETSKLVASEANCMGVTYFIRAEMRGLIAFGLVILGLLLGGDREARAALLVGLTTSNHLLTFNSATPGVISHNVAITGLQLNEEIVSIDRRPANGLIYGVGSTNHLYTIDMISGMASPVGNAFAVALSGTKFSVDFNPEYDRLRLVSNTSQNLRIDPDSGAVVDFDAATPGVQSDANLAFAAGDPNAGSAPHVVAKAYNNNFSGTDETTMYDIDSVLDILVFQGGHPGSGIGTPGGSPLNPNLGVLTTIGALGFDTSELAELEITANNVAFAVLTAPGSPFSDLVTIDLASGNATSIGAIGGGQTLRGLTSLATVPEPSTLALLGLGVFGFAMRRRRILSHIVINAFR